MIDLENGTFKTIPSKQELENICKFYHLPLEIMIDKCVEEYARNKAEQMHNDPEMLKLQKRKAN